MPVSTETQKKNDELSFTEKLNDFIQKNRKTIVIGLALVIVILAVLIITVTVREKVQAKALTTLDDYTRRYDKLKIDTESGAADTVFKLNETAGLLEELKTFAARTSGFAAARAYSLIADIQWDLKNWADAEKAWLEAAGKASKTYLAPVSLYNAAVAAEEQGNLETAVSYYNRALNYGDDFPSAARAQFSVGRIEESRNQKEAAIEAYRKLIGTWPNDPVWSNLAQSRILALEN